MFEDRLIQAVQKHTFLYDKSLVLYRNKPIKEKAWQDVSDEVSVDLELCQSRWRSLRDRFVKEFQRKPKSESGEEGTWRHFKALSFLKAHVIPRRPYSNVKRTYEEPLTSPPDTSTSQYFPIHDIGYKDDESHDFTHSSSDTALPSTSAGRPSKRRYVQAERFDKLMGVVTNMLEKPPEIKSRNANFYKVLDEYLLKLPELVQDETKIKILNLVFNEGIMNE